MQLLGRRTAGVTTASIDARTAGMEREIRGRATATLFDIYVVIHTLSIRPLRLRIRVSNRPALFISTTEQPLLYDHEQPLFVTGLR
jgi:hypothetical protein